MGAVPAGPAVCPEHRRQQSPTECSTPHTVHRTGLPASWVAPSDMGDTRRPPPMLPAPVSHWHGAPVLLSPETRACNVSVHAILAAPLALHAGAGPASVATR